MNKLWRRAVDMTTTVGSLTLPNPILTASGTSGYGGELAAYFDLSELGAIVVKSLSAAGWPGNPAPRVHPLPSGMLNSVGLDNMGMSAWLATRLPELDQLRARVVVSIWGFSVEEYREVARLLAEACRAGRSGAVVAVEVNVSCPNVEDRRAMFAHSAAATAEVTGVVHDELEGCGLPIWVKLSPNVTDLAAIAGAALGAGAEGLTLINTVMGMALDPVSGRPHLGAGGGGLSGPAIHPVAVRAVFDVRSAHPHAPIIGVGGVSTAADAAELLVAGADAVQIGTATFADPRAPQRILSGLQAWCRRNNISSIGDLVGKAHVKRE